MIRIPIRLILSIAVTALSLTLLIWSFTTPERIVRHQVIQPKQMQVSAAAVPETRLLTLEYPAAIRADESDRLQLTVKMQEKTAAAGISNAYETYQVLAETRFDMAGMNVRPAGAVSEPMLPGQNVTFFWSVRPGEVGKSQGTVWLYLRFIPKDGGPEIRQAISAQAIEIESTTFFGLRTESALPLGMLGIFIGVILGFSYFVNGIRKLTTKSI